MTMRHIRPALADTAYQLCCLFPPLWLAACFYALATLPHRGMI